ncbi:VWA domain-containing protein [Nannocystis sp. SCPEA4]|uniref:VWA domain-containing protein n=1 Tax=Nannocystis sp. SCPEA4 TaxID=2996787 RepID=UPI00226E4E01|nr:VWA domain-containing protein [Nannocystis sp. SCPEA4]MCY1062617.1 VWA domain-containing protein [Nannocystis sp. SCPEA4]
MTRAAPFGARPWALLWLALGLGAAAALHRFGPDVPVLLFTLPEWLAARLSEAGDRTLVLARPSVLWLMPVALLPFLVAVARRSLVDLPAWQVALQLGARVLLLLALALALAAPSLQAPRRGKTVVVAVDVSASVDDGQLAAFTGVAREVVRLVRAETGDRDDLTRLRLVTYASRAAALPLSEGTAEVQLSREPDGGLASDHAGALRLAEALLDPDTEGRVVLVSDGAASVAERTDLIAAAEGLRRRGITLHTRTAAPAARGDVLVAGVHLPGELRVGQTFDAAIDVWASEPRTLKLFVDKDGQPNALSPSVEVALRGGPQQIKVPVRANAPGPIVIAARLDAAELAAADNRSLDNDRAAAVGEVRGRPRVLLVGEGDPSGALARALRADHLQVDAEAASAIPGAAEGLQPYDLVILSDVPSRHVSGAQQQAIAKWVQDGGGFVMIGGESAFGVGGWGGSVIEDVLPVRFEGERQREQPTLALVLVIDKSGSMSSEDRLDLVKEAARSTASTLDPGDEIGVIAFDSRPVTLVRLQPAANRIRIAGDIRRLSAGGGTNALPALREAYMQLAGSKALVKHVILLSDGQSPETGVSALITDMRDADITVSAVGVGAGAGKDFLARVAERGRGRYYFSQDGTDVPRIFSRETREVTRNAVVERDLFARVAKSAQVLRGIDFDRAPGLGGVIPLKTKPLAELLLRTHVGDPLLVRGRRGLGRTVAFASDAKPRWAHRWIAWEGFPKFWSQVARDVMRQGAASLGGASLRITPGADEGSFRAVVDLDASTGFVSDLRGELQVIDPSLPPGSEGHTTKLTTQLTAPGRYEATVIGVRAGQRLIKAQMFDDGQTPPRLVAEATGQASVPYPAELAPDQLGADPAWLAALAPEGTHAGPIDAVVTSPGAPQGTRQRPVWPEVLWALALPLLILDLLLRRVAFGRARRGEIG